MEIIWAGTPNYRSGRNGRKIIALVNHITAGSFPGCLHWMQNPDAKASAHYLINQAGDIIQLVKEEDTAWHAGEVRNSSWSLFDGSNPNSYTIGIEHEGYSGLLTEPQYLASLWLHRQLIEKYRLPADSDHIIGHYRIDTINRKNCPGPDFPWSRLWADLLEGSEKNMVRYDTINDIPDWGKATIEKLIAENALIGIVGGNLDISQDMLRVLVINDRMGLYDSSDDKGDK